MGNTIWPKKHLHVDSFECEHHAGHSMLAFQSTTSHLLRSCRRRWSLWYLFVLFSFFIFDLNNSRGYPAMQVVAALLLLLVVVALVTRRVSASFRSAKDIYWSNFFQPPNTGSYRCHLRRRPFLPKRAPKTA